MIIKTKEFFQIISLHYRLPPKARFNDLLGRLTMMADPHNAERLRVCSLTRRCLQLFIARRLA